MPSKNIRQHPRWWKFWLKSAVKSEKKKMSSVAELWDHCTGWGGGAGGRHIAPDAPGLVPHGTRSHYLIADCSIPLSQQTPVLKSLFDGCPCPYNELCSLQERSYPSSEETSGLQSCKDFGQGLHLWRVRLKPGTQSPARDTLTFAELGPESDSRQNRTGSHRHRPPSSSLPQ